MKEFKLSVTYYNKKGVRGSRTYEFEDEHKAQEKYSAWNRLLENEKDVGNVTTYKVVIYRVYWCTEA